MISKTTSASRGVLWATVFASSSALAFLFLSIYSTVKPLKKFHSSDQSQISFEGGLPRDAFFFYLSCNHLGVCVKNAPLNADGPSFLEP
jgi:hypothetical protein